MITIGYFLAVVIGISLGLIGGGGSILTVPILVYLFAIKPELATTYSLFIVGISALIGSYEHYKTGNLNIRMAAVFGGPSIVSLLFTRKFILPVIPNELFTFQNYIVTKSDVIMVAFATLMVAASFSMIKKQKTNTELYRPKNSKLIVIGFFAGLVTGFLGAGGGFLIIPALIFFAGLEMKPAVGTSLLIIAVNALVGFGGDLVIGITLNYPLLFSLGALAIAGIFIGTWLSKKTNGNKLKPAFGWFVLVMGLYIMAKEIFL